MRVRKRAEERAQALVVRMSVGSNLLQATRSSHVCEAFHLQLIFIPLLDGVSFCQGKALNDYYVIFSIPGPLATQVELTYFQAIFSHSMTLMYFKFLILRYIFAVRPIQKSF